jgi:hypothetical protein
MKRLPPEACLKTKQILIAFNLLLCPVALVDEGRSSPPPPPRKTLHAWLGTFLTDSCAG